MGTALVKRDPLDISLPGVTLTATAAVFTGKLKFEEWQNFMQFAKRAKERKAHGTTAPGKNAGENFSPASKRGKTRDIVGEAILKERFVQWVAEKFPDVETAQLLKYQWCACKYENKFTQVNSLSFTHHYIAANVEPPAVRKRLLDRAARDEWPCSVLRKEVRALKATEALEANPLPANKYNLIYADPPWAYNDARMSTTAGGGSGENCCRRSSNKRSPALGRGYITIPQLR